MAVESQIRTAAPVERLFELIDAAPDDRPMLIAGPRRITHGEMRRQVSALARGLKARGIARGDRVAVWLPNVPEWYSVVLACSRLGVAIVSLNVRLGAKEVGDLIARTACKAVVMMPDERAGACVTALRAIEPAKRASLRAVIVHGTAPERVLADVEQTHLDAIALHDGGAVADGRPEDPCLIIATSGTTSLPKLVLHCQGSVCRHVADVAAAAGIGAPDTSMLLALPLCGAFGYTVGMATLQARRPQILMEAFEPVQAAALIREHRVTHMLGTNDMLDKLLDAAPEERPFPSLRMFGHANFVPSLTALPGKAEARGILMRGFYGMSELLAGFAAQPADAPLERRAEAGGLPVCAAATLRICDPDSGAILADGEVGELQVRTPNRMREYFNNPDATAAAVTADGYLRTGDLAYRLPDGGFNFISRMNDVLRIGGYLVSPAEIEEVIARDPAVEICQVVAVSLAQGMRPVAFVVTKPGHALDAPVLLAQCREQLAVYKVPIHIFTIGEIPMIDGPNGRKVLRSALRDIATARLDNKGPIV